MKKLLSLTALSMLTPLAAMAVERADSLDGVQLAQYYSDNFSSEPYYNMDERKAPESVDSYSSRYNNQRSAAADNRKWDLSLGVSVANIPEFIGADDNEWQVFPYISGEYRLSEQNKVFINPRSGIGYQHAYNKRLATGVRTNIRFNRPQGDDPILANTGTVKTAIEVGPYVAVNVTDNLKAEAAVLVDVSGAHESYAVELGGRYNIPTGNDKLTAGVSAGTTFGGSRYMDYYYQVTAAEANADRDEFSTSAGFQDIRYGIDITYFINRSVFLRGDARMRHLISDAKDSPLTPKDHDFMGAMTVGYRF